LADYQHVLADLQPSGLPPPRPSPGQTPERVSLAACRNAADDFIVLRTTRGSVGDFLALFDFSELPSGLLPEAGLIMRGGEATLLHYDAALRPRLEFVIDPHTGYTSRGGVEFPAGGLRVTRVWEQGHPGESLRERRLDNLVVRPRS
ncbi:MAG TPA: hypothetical protein VG013_19005, partial [Gemmataceae bacterium]|nr:hypothetical protein [Gemmataceae bacterium]